MRVKNITYPSPLLEVKDIENGNIDVFVETDDGMTYTFVVTTPNNYYWYMDKEGLDYIPASPPDIIVRTLTDENIRKAIASYLDDEGYWLKLYFLAGKMESTFEVKAMDKMIEEIKETNKKVFED